MQEYLTKQLDWHRDDVTNQYDELPLWSSAFGLMLMDNFPIGDYKHYLDIGCATGFPLLDIAQRLGSGCKSVGIDPWSSAINRARYKANVAGINVSFLEADASSLPFENEKFDLITSNLGINNFENPNAVLSECYRVLKTGASFCATTNLVGTFEAFYDVYAKTLIELGLNQYEGKLNDHINHRGTVESMRSLLEESGFMITKEIEQEYKMRFYDGSAFLNHAFTIVGFIDSWRNMFAEDDKVRFFERFEANLNRYSKAKGELSLTVPMLYLEGRK